MSSGWTLSACALYGLDFKAAFYFRALPMHMTNAFDLSHPVFYFQERSELTGPQDLYEKPKEHKLVRYYARNGCLETGTAQGIRIFKNI